jgi:PAS domain S-box-containing protein
MIHDAEIKRRLQELWVKVKLHLKLSGLGIKSASIPVPAELLYEMYLLQIELEFHNDKLHQEQFALETSKKHYKELFDFAPVGYITLSIEGTITEINFSAANLFGEEPNRIVRRKFEGFIDPSYKEDWHRNFLDTKNQNGKQTCELLLCPFYGTCYFVKVESLFINTGGAGGGELRLMLVVITEQNINRDIMSECEDQLNYGYQATGDDARDWNVVTGEINYSTNWKAMLGCTEDEIIGNFNEWENSIHPHDQQPAIAATHAYLCGDEDVCLNEHRLLCNDGRYKAVLKRGLARSRNLNRTPVRITGTQMDVTKYRQNEELLRIAAAAFESRDAILVMDSNKIILCVNSAFTRLTGYNNEESIDQPVSFFRSTRHKEAFFRNLWADVASDGYWQGELWAEGKNGKIFPLWKTITTVKGADDSIAHYVCTLKDISSQKQTEQALLDARDVLENTLEAKELELEQIKEENVAVKAALNVLLKHQNINKNDAKMALLREVNETVMPFLAKLNLANSGRTQTSRLVNILEANISHIVNAYGCESSLPAAYRLLTHVEAQVVSLVRQGHSTKAIATTLNCSSATVGVHRKHIRKKLGLNDKSNLRIYLSSLTE